MQEIDYIFHLIFTLLSFCIIYPPVEFVALGLTVNDVFSSYLGSQTTEFIQYNIRRTCLTLFVHTILPLIFIVCYFVKFGSLIEYDASENPVKFVWWNAFVIFAIILPAISSLLIAYWCMNGFAKHPLVQNLQKYNPDNWRQTASDINAEFRSDEKIYTPNNSLQAVVATENWIIKISNYRVEIAHQSDTALIAVQSDSHNFGQDRNGTIQFVNIRVKPTRQGVSEFTIRINALDFKLLQDRMIRPITILEGVKFNKTIIDHFVEVFRLHVQLNRVYTPTEETADLCFACMQVQPNVKLRKMCLDAPNEGGTDSACTNCYCRPVFCVDCMAKWFASRQDKVDKDKWLQQKCTCPVCRAKFCMLDVCPIESQ